MLNAWGDRMQVNSESPGKSTLGGRLQPVPPKTLRMASPLRPFARAMPVHKFTPWSATFVERQFS
jgi:hypothetical protein